ERDDPVVVVAEGGSARLRGDRRDFPDATVEDRDAGGGGRVVDADVPHRMLTAQTSSTTSSATSTPPATTFATNDARDRTSFGSRTGAVTAGIDSACFGAVFTAHPGSMPDPPATRSAAAHPAATAPGHARTDE